ncbi:MAG: hypothetical protein H6739_10410 [Alphaproteobacteria bacterium]|nr:hypothetical protein [Alphaproteobacteria bacterium]
MNTLNTALRADEARLNITFDGQNGDLLQPVLVGAADAELLRQAAEAIATGSVPGVRPRGPVDLSGFVVDRFPPTAQVPYHRVFVRPSTPFG